MSDYKELNQDLKKQKAAKKIKERRPIKKIPKYEEGSRKDKGGLKSQYKPEYAKLLMEHMQRGLSFEGFAGKIGICPNTVYGWCREYPEFGYAKQVGNSMSRNFWDELVAMKCETGDSTHPGLINSTYKNRFGWKDRHELTLGEHSEEEIEEIARELLK